MWFNLTNDEIHYGCVYTDLIIKVRWQMKVSLPCMGRVEGRTLRVICYGCGIHLLLYKGKNLIVMITMMRAEKSDPAISHYEIEQ